MVNSAQAVIDSAFESYTRLLTAHKSAAEPYRDRDFLRDIAYGVERSAESLKQSKDKHAIDYFMQRACALVLEVAKVEAPRYTYDFFPIGSLGKDAAIKLTGHPEENFVNLNQRELERLGIRQAPSQTSRTLNALADHLYQARHKDILFPVMCEVALERHRRKFTDCWLDLASIGKDTMRNCAADALDFMTRKSIEFSGDRTLRNYTVSAAITNQSIIKGCDKADEIGLAVVWGRNAFVRQGEKPWERVLLIHHGGDLISAICGTDKNYLMPVAKSIETISKGDTAFKGSIEAAVSRLSLQ